MADDAAVYEFAVPEAVHTHTDAPTCPRCGAVQPAGRVAHGYLSACESCGAWFRVMVEVETRYTTEVVTYGN